MKAKRQKLLKDRQMAGKRLVKLDNANYSLRAKKQDQTLQLCRELEKKDLLNVDKIIHMQLPGNKYLQPQEMADKEIKQVKALHA